MTHNLAATSETVLACYGVLEKFFRNCGLFDYTEGIYYGNSRTPYEHAQHNKLMYLLNAIGCRSGTRVLDISCGAGTLLDMVRERGAVGVGLTVSPEQQRRCQSRGLDVRLTNFLESAADFVGQFDAVVADGSIEHFVQPADAIAGRTDAIYSRMFQGLHRALDPESPVGRVVTSAIHFVRRPDPRLVVHSPAEFPRESDNHHWSLLAQSFGGFYPVHGQFERCAAPYFRATYKTDGTYDYYLTSEEWLRRVRATLRSPRLLRIAWETLPLALLHPGQFATMIECMFKTESWNWQFRGPNPPTRLLRHVWQSLQVERPRTKTQLLTSDTTLVSS